MSLENRQNGEQEIIFSKAERRSKIASPIVQSVFCLGAAAAAILGPSDKAYADGFNGLEEGVITSGELAGLPKFGTAIKERSGGSYSSYQSGSYDIASQMRAEQIAWEAAQNQELADASTDTGKTMYQEGLDILEKMKVWAKKNNIEVSGGLELRDSRNRVEADVTKTWKHKVGERDAETSAAVGGVVDFHNFSDSKGRVTVTHGQKIDQKSAIGVGAQLTTQQDYTLGVAGVTQTQEGVQIDGSVAYSYTNKVAEGDIQVSNQEVTAVKSVTAQVGAKKGKKEVRGSISRVLDGNVKDEGTGQLSNLTKSTTYSVKGKYPVPFGVVGAEALATKPDGQPWHGGELTGTITPNVYPDLTVRATGRRERRWQPNGTSPLKNEGELGLGLANVGGVEGLNVEVSAAHDGDRLTPGLKATYRPPVKQAPKEENQEIKTKLKQDEYVAQAARDYRNNPVMLASLNGEGSGERSSIQRDIQGAARTNFDEIMAAESTEAERHYAYTLAMAAKLPVENVVKSHEEGVRVVASTLGELRIRASYPAYQTLDGIDSLEAQVPVLREFAYKVKGEFGDEGFKLAKLQGDLIQFSDQLAQARETGDTSSLSFNPMGALQSVMSSGGVTSTDVAQSSAATAVNAGVTSTVVANSKKTETTTAADTTPENFSLSTLTDVATNSVQTLASFNVSGINTATAISVSGDGSPQYRINGGGWTNAAGTVNNGDSVEVRHTASGSNSSTRTSSLTIGTVTKSGSSTTVAGGGL